MRTRLLSRTCSSLAFVPKHRSAQEEDVYKLQQLLDKAKNSNEMNSPTCARLFFERL